ncbi:MAG: type II toxin-antitoxin system VapC family toxin [bacterium]
MILDTNAISAILDGDRVLHAVLAFADRHHLPVIAMGEYRYGLKSSKHRLALESLLNRLQSESLMVPLNSATAGHYADIRHELKTAGHPIPENDIWIAALARQHRLPIVSRDEHFDAVSGIQRIGW